MNRNSISLASCLCEGCQRYLVLAVWLAILIDAGLGCADFVFVTGVSSDPSINRETQDSVISVAQHLEIDSGLHRVALISGAPARSHASNFDDFSTTEDFLEYADSLEFTPVEDEPEARRSSRTLDEALEAAARLAIPRRRSGVPLVLILVDDGTAAFSASAATQGMFANFLKKHHYLYFYIISKKGERLRNSLTLSDNEAKIVTVKGSTANELESFIKCEQSLKSSDFRRKPASSGPNSTVAIPRSLVLQTSSSESLLRHNIQLQQRVTANRNKTSNARNSTAIQGLLKRQQAELSPKTTTRLTTTTTPRSFTGKPGCQFDIVLLMDFSGGTGEKERRTCVNLATELVRALDIDEFAAQVALVRYSSSGRSDTVFRLKKHRNATNLIEELRRIEPLGGTTKTGDALLYAKHEFDEKFGGRAKAQKILMLFSDGYSQDDPSEAAKQLKRDRIHIYTVAVHDKQLEPNLEQLKSIASDLQSALLESQFGSLKQKLGRCR